jgi:ribonuclease P protein component
MANPLPNDFRKTARLREAPEYQAVFKNGVKLSGVFFRLYYLKNDATHPRLGMAVPKKVIPLSVQRNRLKRICRELFRQNHALLPGDYVVVAQARVKLAENKLIKTELLQLMNRFSEQKPQ